MLLLFCGAWAALVFLILNGEPVGKKSVVAAALFTCTGVLQFLKTAQKIVHHPVLPIAAACVLAVGGLYGMYWLSGLMDDVMRRIFQRGSEELPINYGLVVGGAAFFVLASRGESWQWIFQSGTMALGMLWITARYIPDIRFSWKRTPVLCRSWCAASAAGIGLFLWDHFPAGGIGAVLALAAAVGFLYPMVLALFKRLLAVAASCCGDISKEERWLYAMLFSFFALFSLFVFLHSEAYYGTELLYDLVYTSDSPTLFRDENSYMWLLSFQNDLRQPLFAAFCAPLTGPSYLAGRVLGADLAVQAFLMNLPMIAMLLASYFLIAQIMGLQGYKRMLFMLLCSLSYPALLFSIMMEQYIPALFYLALLMHSVSRKVPDEVWFWGANGTLITSAVTILLLNPDLHPVRDMKKLIVRWTRQMVGFVGAMIGLGRLDVILDSARQIVELRRFSGKIPFQQKFFQFSTFFSSCLTAPDAGPMENQWGVLSWQLFPAFSLHYAGLCVIALCVVGAFVGRRKPGTWMAVCWMAFSGMILLVMGWGCPENGLILYALYFGWVIPVLLFRLMETVKKRRIFLCMNAAVIAALAARNIPAIAEMVSFSISAFPHR